jgi:hypothetical protein
MPPARFDEVRVNNAKKPTMAPHWLLVPREEIAVIERFDTDCCGEWPPG